MTRKNIGLVGYGYWGRNLARNFHALGALAATCDASPTHRDAFKKDYPDVPVLDSYGALLKRSDIQGIVLATPAADHFAMAEVALSAGKDVFVEKPLALDVPSGEKLLVLAKKKKAILMVGHLLWYHPAILKLKELMQRGELGRIQYIYSNRLNLGKIRSEENILWSFAPHDLSVILGLLNETPNTVTAQGGNYLKAEVADVTVSTLNFPSGKKAHIFVSWLHPFKEQKLIVIGDKKMAVFDDLLHEEKLTLYPHKIEWQGEIPIVHKAKGEHIPIAKNEPLRSECAHFLQCMETRETPRTDGEEALRVLRVLEQCQNALENPITTDGKEDLKMKFPDCEIHPTVSIDTNVRIGAGTTIWHVSHVLKDTRLGKNCRIGQNVVIGPRVSVGNNVKIQNNVSVYEGVTLEDDVFCGPSTVFTNVRTPRSEFPRMKEHGKTHVAQGATLGANCTIVCGVRIGTYALVGAGAVVTHDVADYSLVMGVPAKHTAWVCRCGIKLKGVKNAFHCPSCQTRYSQKKGRLTPFVVRPH